MGDKVMVKHPDAAYVQFWNRDGEVADIVGTAFVPYATANIANYAQTLTDGGNDTYYATVPAWIAEGAYHAIFYDGVVSEDDNRLHTEVFQWDGAALASLPERTIPLSRSDNAEAYFDALIEFEVTGSVVTGVYNTVTKVRSFDVDITGDFRNTLGMFYSGTPRGRTFHIVNTSTSTSTISVDVSDGHLLDSPSTGDKGFIFGSPSTYVDESENNDAP